MKELVEQYGEAVIYLLAGGVFVGFMMWTAQQFSSM